MRQYSRDFKLRQQQLANEHNQLQAKIDGAISAEERSFYLAKQQQLGKQMEERHNEWNAPSPTLLQRVGKFLRSFKFW